MDDRHSSNITKLGEKIIIITELTNQKPANISTGERERDNLHFACEEVAYHY
jgi:hypothetical protein